MRGSTHRCYNITERQIGAVDIRHNNAKLSPNTPTVAHSPVTSKSLPDTAATSHYLHPSALPHYSQVANTTSGPTVQVANGHIIRPAFSATLQLSSKLSSKAQYAHVFKEITTGSLISMGELCDDNSVAIVTKYDVKILKHNQVIIPGLRD